MERVIITTLGVQTEGYEIYESLKLVADPAQVEKLVFHESSDEVLDNILELSKYDKTVTEFFYVNNEPNALMCNVFNGLSGAVYSDEDILQDKEILNYVVSKGVASGLAWKPPIQDVRDLEACIQELADADKAKTGQVMCTDLWVATVNRTLTNITSSLTRQDMSDQQMLDFLGEVLHFIDNIKQSQNSTVQEMEKLRRMLQDYQKMSGLNMLSTFATVEAPIYVKNVAYIKEVGHCRYLYSFLVGYMAYLKAQKNIHAKMLIVLPRSKEFLEKYSAYPMLSSDSLSMVTDTHNIYVTFEPKKAVFEKFFSYPKDVGIVVDSLFQEDLIRGVHVEKFLALGGLGDAMRYTNKAPAKRLIFCMTGITGAIIIPHIQNYSKQKELSRISMYNNSSRELFAKMDTELKVNQIK